MIKPEMWMEGPVKELESRYLNCEGNMEGVWPFKRNAYGKHFGLSLRYNKVGVY